LTLDDEAFRQSVESVEVGIIPQGGTALIEAIQTAVTAFKKEGDDVKVLVVFTDGEDHEQGTIEAAQSAAKAGLRIFTIGVGTAEGELLRQKDENGNLSYVKDEKGNVVKSRLNETVLREIAQAANGFYLPLRGAGVIEALYKQGLAPLPKTELSAKRLQRFHERYQWPLGLAVLLLILELFLPERKRVSRSETIVTAPNAELRKAVRRARDTGFKGAVCPHVSWIKICNEGFRPSPEETAYYVKVREVFAEGLKRGMASVPIDGKMIDVPVDLRAKIYLEWADRAQARDEEKARAHEKGRQP
jgi:hypothetical protein